MVVSFLLRGELFPYFLFFAFDSDIFGGLEVFDDDVCTRVFLIFVIYFCFMILEFTLFHRADHNR